MVVAGDLAELKQTNERVRGQVAESQYREKVLVRRLAVKEQETQDLVVSTIVRPWFKCSISQCSDCVLSAYKRELRFISPKKHVRSVTVCRPNALPRFLACGC